MGPTLQQSKLWGDGGLHCIPAQYSSQRIAVIALHTVYLICANTYSGGRANPMENGMNTMNSDVINHEIPSNDFITSSLPLIQ